MIPTSRACLQDTARKADDGESIWHGIEEWLEEPVPEYDLDTGDQVGTRTRARAIATNPLTIISAGAVALTGAEAVLAGGAVAAAETTAPVVVEEAGLAANAARGLASQARVLKDLGLVKNTKLVVTSEGRAIPDALTDLISVEIKDVAYVARTAQVRVQTGAAAAAGRESILVTGIKTRISRPAEEAFNTIIRRLDLVPRTGSWTRSEALTYCIASDSSENRCALFGPML